MINLNSNILSIFLITIFILYIIIIQTVEFYSSTVPVYYINLDKDSDRDKLIKPILTNIFGKTNVFRVPGVIHEQGMQGCRLAHIKAHKTAISNTYLGDDDYYLICEDDIIPLENKETIIKYINEAKNFNKDLYLFVCTNRPEWINLEYDNNEYFYRLLGNVGNTGCYLCKKSFGKKLISFWEKNTNNHIDWSWQELWKIYKTYLSRPNLFVQRSGKSNHNIKSSGESAGALEIDGMLYRSDNSVHTTPFDWEKWEKMGKNRKK